MPCRDFAAHGRANAEHVGKVQYTSSMVGSHRTELV